MRRRLRLTRRFGLISAIIFVVALALSAPSSASELHEQQLVIDGRDRDYLLSVPPYPRPLPTIIALHGTLINARQATVSMGLQPLVDSEGLAAIYPSAVAAQWNDGRSLAATWTAGHVDDVSFLRRLIGDLVNSGISDPHRLYVAGFSNGGMMALRLMCEAPELLAAAAAIAASLPVELVEHCSPTRPVPLLLMNGTADRVVPYEGGGLAFGGGQVLSTEQTIRFWRGVNRCTDQMDVQTLPNVDDADGTSVNTETWSKCASGAPVVLYRIAGGGHRIPGRREDWPVADVFLGKKNGDFEAAYAIWNFFKNKKR